VSRARDAQERRGASALDRARSGGGDARIEVVDYDDSWPGRFASERARLAALLPGTVLHHIGSTAVPGLAAKPIIDMMAVVDDLDSAVSALVGRGGYEHPPAYNAVLDARRWLCRPSASRRTHHLHLVADAEELARHLRFRDALRRDARLARRYAALKRELAGRMADDREGYTAAKTSFIRRVESAS
jgi:GrpB-like predicted nucleotidyltransferase (UPF0157 family)